MFNGEIAMNNNVSWLVTCPSNDGNFKIHLEYASAEEVREALEIITGQHNTKTKEKILRAALKRKERTQRDRREEMLIKRDNGEWRSG